MRPELDESVARTVTRYYRLVTLAYLAFASITVGVFAYAFLLAPPTTTIAIGVAGLAVACLAHVPRFDLSTETRLETDKSPDAVRDDLESVANPFTALAVGWADEIHDRQPDEEAVDVALEGTFLGLFAHEYRLRIDRTGEHALLLRFGEDDDPTRTTELSIHPRDQGTRIDVTSTRQSTRLAGLLLVTLQARFQEQILSAFDYHGTALSTDISLRVW